MDTMVKEKDAAIEKAMGFEAETEELNKVRLSQSSGHEVTLSWSLWSKMTTADKETDNKRWKAASKFEKEVDTIQREIAKVEDNLDIAMSSTKETADKLELADKEAIDAELQVGALKRRLALLEEEASRNKAKLQVS